jgi:Dolichyl-phosphate-mannose-protein mannosyltransferase
MNVELPTSNFERSTGEKRFFWFGVGLITLAAVVAMIASTRWGIGLSSDSARYVRTARHILGVEPVIESGEPKHEQAHYPPFFPLALAAFSWITRSDPLVAARWLSIAILAANTVLSAVIVRRFGGSTWAALIAAALVGLSPVSQWMHGWLLTETLFILLSLVAILLLCSYLERPRLSRVTAAGLAGSLGALTRYAGASTGPAGVLSILLLSRQPIRRRILDAAVFAVTFLFLPMLSFARNLLTAGTATNRTIAFHPISLDHLKDAIAALGTWVSPLGVDQSRLDAKMHPLLVAIGVLLFVGVVAIGCVVAFRQRNALAMLTSVALLYATCFVALIVFSISFVDFHTPADTRILSPVYIAWVIVLACAATAAAQAMPPARQRVIVAACAFLAVVCIMPSIELLKRRFRDGEGFAHREWRTSPTIAAVRQLPPDTKIFTNAPGVIYLLTRRQEILIVPSAINASSRLPNPEYAGLMARIRDDLRARRGVLVYLKNYGKRRAFYPSEQELRRRLALLPRVRLSDGAIYDASPTPTTTTQSAER